MAALTNGNANVGGNYLTLGAQNYNIRGLGLITGIADIENVMVAERRDPYFRQDVGDRVGRPSSAFGGRWGSTTTTMWSKA